MVSVALAAILAVPFPALAQEDPVQAGVSAAVKGEIQLARAFDNTIGKRLDSGEPIYLRDVISAGPDSTMQILLMDETVFTIGENSELVIDEFVYDPETNIGKVSAQILRGAFRFTTGLVGQEDPDSVSIGTPLGTIGIRGTIVAGEVGVEEALVILIGPGDEAGTKERVGRIEVSNDEGSVEISRSGYGTTLTDTAPPSPPVQIPQARIDGILSSVQGEGTQTEDDTPEAGETTATNEEDSGTDPDGDTEDGTAADQGGENSGSSDQSSASTDTGGGTESGTDSSAPQGETAASSPATGSTTATTAPSPSAPSPSAPSTASSLSTSVGGSSVDTLSGASIASALDGAGSLGQVGGVEEEVGDTIATVVESTTSTLGSITTLEDLASISTGTGSISGGGSLSGTVNASGSYTFTGTFDFGSQSASFTMDASWTGTNAGSFKINATSENYVQIFENGNVFSSFDSDGGHIQPFTQSDPDVDLQGSPITDLRVDVRLRNQGNTVAAAMDTKVNAVINTETVTGEATGTR